MNKNLPWKINPEKFKRFNQKNTVFCRHYWDKNLRNMVKGRAEYARKLISNRVEGYSLFDFALKGAAWYCANVAAGEGNPRGDYGLFSWNSLTTLWYSYGVEKAERDPVIREERRRLRKNITPSTMTYIIKKVAKYFGADLVGIAKYDPRWVYTHRFVHSEALSAVDGFYEEPIRIPDEVKYVIVMAFEEDYDTIRCVPNEVGEASTGWGYTRQVITAASVAEFLRSLGFIGIPSGNDTALSIPYAIMAGLGEYSRMGILITREFGPRVRLSKVFTDAPLIPDAPIRFGVYEFCQKCRKCAEHCPAKAIPFGEPTWEGPSAVSNMQGIWKWYIDPEKCYSQWIKSVGSCGICVRVCPYNKPNTLPHKIFKKIILPIIGPSLARKLDDMLGYGKMRRPSDFWKVPLPR